jgi:prephenate dehydratase/prephenate dehydrogenase
MTATAEDRPAPPLSNLIVVGAAGGMARLLITDILSALDWSDVWLVDVDEAVFDLQYPFASSTRVYPVVATRDDGDGGHGSPVGRDRQPVDLGGLDAVVCVAVQQDQLAEATSWLLPGLGEQSIVFDISSEKTTSMSLLATLAPHIVVFGTHPLYGHAVGTTKGQTFVVCPSTKAPEAQRWLIAAINAAQGLSVEISAERHDLIMSYVQTAAHQALILFADVLVNSGLDLEQELWSLRTPPFETLLSLAARVLAPTQQRTIASIQIASSDKRINREYGEAQLRLQRAVETGSIEGVKTHIDGVLERFDSAFYYKVLRMSDLAIRAIQAPRSLLAQQRHSGELTGIAMKDRRNNLRVGEVLEVTPTTVKVRNLLVGGKGDAALLGPYVDGARRLGLSGSPENVTLSLGKVDIYVGSELEPLLEEWLGSLQADIRLLGPESVSGEAMAAVALKHPGVRAVDLVSSQVRAGQREFVIRCQVRADHDLGSLLGALQASVDKVYAWPLGVLAARPEHPPGWSHPRIGYLGPPGTFSATAAAQLWQLLPRTSAEPGSTYDPVPADSFADLFRQLRDGSVDFAVLPLCNSASGLVESAAEALIGQARETRALGVVDVQVRLDAYGTATQAASSGASVLSHLQALKQCQRFIKGRHLVEVGCDSTVDGLTKVRDGLGDVALAPPGLASQFGLRVIATNVGDLSGAVTRFLVLVRRDPVMDGMPSAHEAPVVPGTTSWLWLLERGTAIPPAPPAARYEEVIEGDSGLRLSIGTDADRYQGIAGAHFVGGLPWSPRTPLVKP